MQKMSGQCVAVFATELLTESLTVCDMTGVLDAEGFLETESLLTSDSAAINGAVDRMLKTSSTNGDKTLNGRHGNRL